MVKRDLGLFALAALISFSADAQVTTVDGGAAVEDVSGLEFATTIATGIGYLPGLGGETSFDWVASLNAENYGGYSDWTVSTGIGTDPVNTPTNQLGQLLKTDCGNAAGAALSCNSFANLETVLQSTRVTAQGYQVFYARNLYTATCCNALTTEWWAYISTPTFGYQSAWNYDSALEGTLGHADAIAVREAPSAPEMDGSTAFGALLMLGGGLAVAIDRKRMTGAV